MPGSLKLLWVLNGLDVLTTRLVIESGGREMNPLLEPFAHSGIQLAAVKMAVLGAASLPLRHSPGLCAALCGLYGAVVGWNALQLL